MDDPAKVARGRRSNFAFDDAVVSQITVLIDHHERLHGFRPSMSQIVSGLIGQAVATILKGREEHD